jgi:hypothetical protein
MKHYFWRDRSVPDQLMDPVLDKPNSRKGSFCEDFRCFDRVWSAC